MDRITKNRYSKYSAMNQETQAEITLGLAMANGNLSKKEVLTQLSAISIANADGDTMSIMCTHWERSVHVIDPTEGLTEQDISTAMIALRQELVDRNPF